MSIECIIRKAFATIVSVIFVINKGRQKFEISYFKFYCCLFIVVIRNAPAASMCGANKRDKPK